ncbi:sensor histidine kinase [Sphingobacterium griseoflavum]|uniref:histidine kinase n=1 Tax=Sphingobacterium griseoflavum TaxID=1474952 RepID=A0ABQ3I117_9SPHI|nr:histidine kinase [Sphingobacterium griseoflavum]GHE39898.1 hypothetical protein GCM10017764_24050 [Sphingobacterium griseoflavum]
MFVCGLGSCFAKSPYRQVRVLDGIDKEHSMFSRAAKDPAGMIWAVAGGELFRYDGVHVLSFAKLYPGRLPFDEIQDLTIDPWGRLWLNTRNGLLIFDLATWQFCDEQPYAQRLHQHKAIGFAEVKGDFFMATDRGEVFQITATGKEFLFSFDYTKGLGRTPVGRLFVADEEGVWLAINGRLYHYDRKREKRRLCAIPSRIFDKLEDLLPLKGGLLLRNYRDGYYIYDGRHFVLSRFRSTNENDFTNWNHWAFAEGDRLRFFHQKGRYSEHTRDLSLTKMNEGDHRLAEEILYKRLNNWQRSGDEWLLSTDQGLYAVFPAEVSFDFIECGSARGMVKQQGQYFIGGYGHLHLLSPAGGLRAFIEAPEKNYYAFFSLAPDTAIAVIEGEFLGYLQHGRYVPAPITVDLKYRDQFSTMAYCASRFDKETMLVGTANGIWKYTLRSGRVTPLLDRDGRIAGEGMRVLSIRYENGLLSFSGEDGYFVYRQMRVEKLYPLDHAHLAIYDHVCDQSKVYLATKGRGLVVLDKGTASVFRVEQGLSSNIVYQLFNYNGTIFAGTHRGLSVITQNKIYNYHIADGLPFEEFNHKALYHDDAKGKLFMGGTQGYVAFDPQELLQVAERDFAATPTVSSMHIGMRTNLFQHNYAWLQLRDTMELPRDAVMFTLDFARVNHYRQGYAMHYKIEPLMDGYQEMPVSNQINLSGMTAGEYRIFVQVSPSNTARTQTWSWLVKKPPVFMETQGFYFLLLLGAGAITTYVLFERNRRKKNEKLLRRQISSDLHDEVGSLLTGISMQADLLMLRGEAPMQESVLSIGKFSREATQMMDDIVWSIDGRNNYQGSLEDRIKFLAANMLEPLGAQIVFDVLIDYDKSLRQIVRQQVYLLFKEMLHNICKHAQPSRIDILLHVQHGELRLRVSNNGLIAHAENRKWRTGQGMANMEARVNQIGGTISRWMEQECFVIELKVPSRRSKVRWSALHKLDK